MESEKKSFWRDLERIVIVNRIKYLYHFTDKENLKSIIEGGGLYSWQYCVNNFIDIPRPGGNDLSRKLDRGKNLENYVRLSFAEIHPMIYRAKDEKRIVNPIIIRVNTDVIYLKGTLYSNRNATEESNNVIIGEEAAHLGKVKFSIVRRRYLNLNPIEQKYFQAEVLVPEIIPIKYLINYYDLKI